MFLPPMHYLSTWFREIITIRNSNRDGTSYWHIPLCLFTSVKVFPSALNSTNQLFMASIMNFMTFSDILNILRQSYYPALRDNIVYLCVANLCHSHIFSSHLAFLDDVLIPCSSWSFVTFFSVLLFHIYLSLKCPIQNYTNGYLSRENHLL